MRTIPINEALEDTRGIADYDKVRDMIQKSVGPFMIGPCVCKIGKDIQKKPCKITKRRDVCMAVGPMAEMFLREGWGGRKITKQEALEIQALNEKEGLIMQVENNANPEFFCGCCDCCCGPLHMGQYPPRSIDFIKNNVHAKVNQELCNSCRACMKICPMKAATIPEEFDENELLSKNGKPKARINLNKCIGCGLCVPKCLKKSIHLVKNDVEVVPPKDRDDMMNKIREGKRGLIKQKLRLLKATKGKPV
jgi:formate hydrogenlyase subunit 6/NADH:ubiquinone oxidoreductase subunit I